MKIVSVLFLFLFLGTNILANNDRALYIKQYRDESKTALIIGNSNYSYFSKLKNSKNDAFDMKTILKNQGFDILYLEDASLRNMKKIVRNFSKKLKNGGVGFFFYAGHGIEVEGKNYLIPIDANIPEKNEVEYEALSMNLILNKMEDSNNRLNIVVLDACRNDPFSRGSNGGLAQINNAKGMYIAYATAPGKVASDGSGKNGLFTKNLINNIKKPNLKLNEVFAKTRKDVYEQSKNKQLPWTSSSVIGDFYFKIEKENIVYQKRKIEKKVQEESSFNFKDIIPTTFKLYIKATPSNANISIMNIKEKYYNGIKLPKGNYKIKVSKSGYIAKSGNINLKNNLSLDIQLDKEIVNKVINTNKKVNINIKAAKREEITKNKNVKVIKRKIIHTKENKLFKEVKNNFSKYSSSNIKIKLPDIAENGAVIPIRTSIIDTQKGTLSIFSDANKSPFITSFESYINRDKYQYSCRFKMSKSEYIYAVYQSPNGKIIANREKVKVVKNYNSSNDKDFSSKNKIRIKAKRGTLKFMINSSMTQSHHITNINISEDDELSVNIKTSSNLSKNPFMKLLINKKTSSITINTQNNKNKQYSKKAKNK